MTEKTCSREDRIRKALAAGESSPEMAAHIAACPVCREAAAVVSALGQIRKASLERFAAAARIPEAADLLGKTRRRPVPGSVEAGEILGPIRFYRRFLLPVGLIAGVITAILNLSSIKNLILSMPGVPSLVDGVRSLSTGPGGDAFGLPIAFAVMGLLTLIILAAAMRSKPEKP